jgi:sec-independent protein translocase protein TatA
MVPEITPLFAVPGGMELVVVLLIAVLLFGANKIPKLARSTGEAMGEFQKGREEVEQELQEMRDGTSTGAGSDLDDDEFVDTEPVTSEDADTETETDRSDN